MIEPRVLFVGDSFVAGAGDPQGRGWVGRVVEAAFAAGMRARAYNLGVGGDTSALAAARWPAESAARVAAEADMRAVLSFGANDTTIEDGAPRVSPGASIANLERVLDDAAARGIGCFVVGPGPVGDETQDARSAALEAAFAMACRMRRVPFVAILEPLRADATWTAEAASGDGAHPGAGGYDRLAALVLAGGFVEWLSA